MKKKTWTGLEVGGGNKRFSKIYTKKENGVKNLKRKLIEGKKEKSGSDKDCIDIRYFPPASVVNVKTPIKTIYMLIFLHNTTNINTVYLLKLRLN